MRRTARGTACARLDRSLHAPRRDPGVEREHGLEGHDRLQHSDRHRSSLRGAALDHRFGGDRRNNAAGVRRQADRGDQVTRLAAGSRGIRIRAGETTVRGLVVNGFSSQIVADRSSHRPATATASSATTSAPTSRGLSPPDARQRHPHPRRQGSRDRRPDSGDRNVISGSGVGITVEPGPARSRSRATTSARTQAARRPYKGSSPSPGGGFIVESPGRSSSAATTPERAT